MCRNINRCQLSKSFDIFNMFRRSEIPVIAKIITLFVYLDICGAQNLLADIKLNRCCPSGSDYLNGKCVVTRTADMDHNFEIYDSRNPDVLISPNSYNIELSQYLPPCPERFMLYPSEYKILSNGSLLSNSTTGFHIDEISTYCFAVNKLDETIPAVVLPFLCNGEFFPFVATCIKICLVLSAILLFITSIVYWCVPQLHEPLGWNINGYAISLSICIYLLILRLFSNNISDSLGYLFHASSFSSFVWLALINSELFFRVRYYSREYPLSDKKRKWLYLGVNIGFTLLILSILFIFKFKTSVPNYLAATSFAKATKFMYTLYFLILVWNFILLAYIRSQMIVIGKWGERLVWRLSKRTLVGIFRAYLVVLLISVMCIASEFLSYYLDNTNSVVLSLKIIHSMQGIFVFLIFVVYQSVYDTARLVRNYIRNNSDALMSTTLSSDQLNESSFDRSNTRDSLA